MPRIIHHFVDKDGRTHVDTFNSNIPLDMGDIPREYHICLVTQTNARLLAELYKECDTGSYEKKLMVGCPSAGIARYGFGKFEDAKDLIRQMCFENPHPIHGGLRSATMVDYTNARVVAQFVDISRQIQRGVNEAAQKGLQEVMKVTQQVYQSLDVPEVINTVSAHPLWRRMSWIFMMKPMLVLNLIGVLVDPTWYVNPDDPARSGLFKEHCGVYNAREAAMGQHVSTPLWLSLLTPFTALLNQSQFDMQALNAPGFFFIRYGFRWMQKYRQNGIGAMEALFLAGWHHNVKLINFIWLSWMEVMHESPPQELDEERFFIGDRATAETAYRSAVS